MHANDTLSDAQWEELQILDYQYVELASNADSRILFDCLLPGISGACIKYGAARKRAL